jgi:hypothetical protein
MHNARAVAAQKPLVTHTGFTSSRTQSEGENAVALAVKFRILLELGQIQRSAVPVLAPSR